jgi:hypothetical protein
MIELPFLGQFAAKENQPPLPCAYEKFHLQLLLARKTTVFTERLFVPNPTPSSVASVRCSFFPILLSAQSMRQAGEAASYPDQCQSRACRSHLRAG